MRVLRRTRRAIWTALAGIVLLQPTPVLAQGGAASGLDISLKDGRLSVNVHDVALSQVLRTIAAKGEFALDIAGQLDSKVSASFENVPLDRGLRRIVGRSSYIIELAPATGAQKPRRIAKLSVFARGAPKRVNTSSTPRTKRGKAAASKAKRSKRRGDAKKRERRRRPGSPSS
jgi:hypothetical protein